MLPYLDLSQIRLGPVRLHPFGLLLVTGVIVGHTLLVRRLRSHRLADAWSAEYFAMITVGSALLGAYLEGTLIAWLARAYPLASPGLSRLSMSSLGGVMGAMLSGFWYIRRKRMPLLPTADAASYAFSWAWLIARMGCGLVHDHLGPRSSSVFAVRFPTGPRFDLGLLEALGMVLIVALAAWAERRRLPSGSVFGAVALSYPLLRFPLDFLRDPATDPRFLSLTAAQWQCLLLFTIGLSVILKVLPRSRPSKAAVQ